ncbi:hypothetical protein QVD17_39328 [Tagetes erecta]|uniref:Gnk2-homologous domain-containing protein n=1 Tax=Tagetes erecta TaxID=13708 RepID=A0AAD8JNC1_TARER|nr:hypothetical protein QVD17_39328 [Tagetes erecta]
MAKKNTSPIASLHISSWISTMVVMVFLMMSKHAASQSGGTNNALLRKYCRTYTTTGNGESYLRNVNIIFSSIRRQLSDPQSYYAYAQTKNSGEFVYAFALCREYLSTSQCLACFDSAVNETKSCGIADGGNIIYDYCNIRTLSSNNNQKLESLQQLLLKCGFK